MDKVKTVFSDSTSFIIFGLIVTATIILASIVGKYLKNVLEKKSKEQNADITSFLFIKHVIRATIYFFGLGWAFLTLPISANFAQSLFAGAGASTLILGFASQQILSNLMSGVFLIVKKPFKVNDIIEIQGNRGRVVELNLHDTIIEDADNNTIIIPNALISNGIIKNLKKP